ncbi:MAG: DUF6350 family protein [Micrococcales bacterium]|nr:DUF6350 family protein [Micrococcales bacterium]
MNASSQTMPAARATYGVLPWVSGLLAGVQAALLSWICVAVPAVAVFVSTAEARINDGVSWLDASRLGSSLWLVGHGGWAHISSGPRAGVVSLAPLGMALISVLACKALSKVATSNGWWLVGFGTLGFVLVTAVVGYVMASQARASVGVALPTAAVTALVGFIWGNAPAGNGRLLGPLRAPMARLPEIATAFRAAGLAFAVMLAGAAVVTLAWSIGGGNSFRTIFASLEPGGLGGLVLALLAAALAPNLLTYALAYLAGPGFMVGEGTAFTVIQTSGGPMPAIPILGLLPQTDPPWAARGLVLVPVAAGLLAGWLISRRLADGAWWRRGLTALVTAGVTAGWASALVVLTSGSIGPGRMASVGAAAGPVAAAVAAEVAAGALLGALLLPQAKRIWRFATKRLGLRQ